MKRIFYSGLIGLFIFASPATFAYHHHHHGYHHHHYGHKHHTPPGWHHGLKKGWHGRPVPPSHH